MSNIGGSSERTRRTEEVSKEDAPNGLLIESTSEETRTAKCFTASAARAQIRGGGSHSTHAVLHCCSDRAGPGFFQKLLESFNYVQARYFTPRWCFEKLLCFKQVCGL